MFVPDENAAAAAGLATGDLPSRLNAALLGALAGTVQEGNTELDVRVRLDNAYRDDVADLTTLPMISASKPMLSAVLMSALTSFGKQEPP